MLKAIAPILVELMVVTATALLFSTFSSPLLSAVLTFGLYIAGNFSAELGNFATIVESTTVGMLARALYYVLPNFASFDVKAAVVHAQPVTASYMLVTTAYGFTYIGALLLGAMVIFSRRDFK
jgi:hypothetical protein